MKKVWLAKCLEESYYLFGSCTVLFIFTVALVTW